MGHHPETGRTPGSQDGGIRLCGDKEHGSIRKADIVQSIPQGFCEQGAWADAPSDNRILRSHVSQQGQSPFPHDCPRVLVAPEGGSENTMATFKALRVPGAHYTVWEGARGVGSPDSPRGGENARTTGTEREPGFR